MNFPKAVFLLIGLVSLQALSAKPIQSPLQVLKIFVGDINRHEYRKAYRLFSYPLREKVNYGDFHDGATHVKWVRLVSAKLVSMNSKAATARVILEDLERDPDEDRWTKEKYGGKIVFLREKAGWRFIQAIGNKGGLSDGLTTK